MISNNAGDQIEPAVQEAADAGIAVVAWDSPIPSGQGESLFVAQVDFDETGQVMADMATEILGPEGGEIAILSASPDAANQNAWIASFEEVLAEPDYASLQLVDTVYGNDDADESYNQALALIDAHPDLKLIMAPTTVGIAAAAKAMQDEGLCETVKVSGLGLPDEMRTYTENGCAPQFALWSFVDLGYLTFYAAHAIATGELTAEEGATFEAGRMGEYTIEVDPTRDNGLRIVMGPVLGLRREQRWRMNQLRDDEPDRLPSPGPTPSCSTTTDDTIEDVWPEMRDALHRCGWHNYSLFLDDDGTLFGYFETDATLDGSRRGDAVGAGERAMAGADGSVLRRRRDRCRPSDAGTRRGVPPAMSGQRCVLGAEVLESGNLRARMRSHHATRGST